MEPLRSRPRFPEIPLGAGHYESFFIKACHPAGERAVWVRYTVLKRPGAPPTGSVWFTLFDAAAGGSVASKVTLGFGDLGSDPDHYIHVGASRLAPGRAIGRAVTDQLDASWNLAFESKELPQLHLPRRWMYRGPIPRTKLLSPYPAATFNGWVDAGGRRVEVDGWPGTTGHNWGPEHAERWIWMHGINFAGEAADTWLDVSIARVKLGPVTTPWIGVGHLSLEGRRYPLGGVERAASTEVRASSDRCEFVLPGKGIGVRGTVGSARERFVGWIYEGPDGSTRDVVNCSIADMTLTVSGRGRSERTLRVAGGAAYEIGGRERDHGVPLQPFGE